MLQNFQSSFDVDHNPLRSPPMGKARLEVLELLRSARTPGGVSAFLSPVLPPPDSDASACAQSKAVLEHDVSLALSEEAPCATRHSVPWSASAYVDAVLHRARSPQHRSPPPAASDMMWQVRGPLFASPGQKMDRGFAASTSTQAPERGPREDVRELAVGSKVEALSAREHHAQERERAGATENERREWVREKQRLESLLAHETERFQRERELLLEERAAREKERSDMRAQLDELTQKLKAQERELCEAKCHAAEATHARNPDTAEFEAERIIRKARAQAEEVKNKCEQEMKQMKMAICTKVAAREEAKAIQSEAEHLRHEAEEYLDKAR